MGIPYTDADLDLIAEAKVSIASAAQRIHWGSDAFIQSFSREKSIDYRFRQFQRMAIIGYLQGRYDAQGINLRYNSVTGNIDATFRKGI
jgi:hypothetical protein